MQSTHRRALVALVALAATAVPIGAAAPAGAAATSTCTTAAPTVLVENTISWGVTGLWSRPGESRTVSVHVVDRDSSGCASAKLTLALGAPAGFTVAVPTTTLSLRAYPQTPSEGYLAATVTAPAGALDGDYPLTVTVRRVGGETVSVGTVDKVYSSDVVAPTLFWPSVADGQVVSGRSTTLSVSAQDDHVLRSMAVAIDGVVAANVTCAGISYQCSVAATWDLRRAATGTHVVRFSAVDAFGNATIQDVTVTKA